jgi:uncharacterized membrane protein YdfJ with MMPL/SSD domain
MLTVVNILILIFIVIIAYQLILAIHVKEGLENNDESVNYQPYDMNNPANALILAQQNAGNINYLKQRFDSVQGMYQQVQDLSGNVAALQDQVDGLVSAQQEYATQMTGGVAPDVTGATTEDSDTTEDLTDTTGDPTMT